MHEFSITSSIVENVLGFAAEQEAARVLAVRVVVGELTHLESEQMKFCFEAITRETPLEGSSLEIETAPAQVACRSCDYAGPPKYWEDVLAAAPIPTLQCPQCGKVVDVTEGQECSIKTVQFVR